MMICDGCGAEIEEDRSRFCEECCADGAAFLAKAAN